jgi:hypothetical protein
MKYLKLKLQPPQVTVSRPDLPVVTIAIKLTFLCSAYGIMVCTIDGAI